MNTTIKKWVIASGIAALIGLSVIAFAAFDGNGLAGGHCMMKPERLHQLIDWKIDDFLSEIDATAEQREEVTGIKERLMREGMAMHGELSGIHAELFLEWQSDNPSMNKIYSSINEAFQLKETFAKKAAASIVELHGLLTPEQREMVSSKIQAHFDQCHKLLNSH